jgi:hypothetical protein
LSIALWQQAAPVPEKEKPATAAAPVPDPASIEPLSIEQAEQIADRTLELLASQGYCLWRCRAQGGQVIMVVDQALPQGAPAGYPTGIPAYTLAEITLISHKPLSTLRLIDHIKSKSGAVVIPNDKKAG